MRSFTIRTRMHGAIAMVLAMFAAIGLTGLMGGRHLAALNEDFVAHSLQETTHVGEMRLALAQLRLAEKDSALAFDNAGQVRQARQAWDAAGKQLSTALNGMLAGEEDDDNPIARESLKLLEDYRTAAGAALGQIEGGADSARSASQLLEPSKAGLQEIDRRVERIAEIVSRETKTTQSDFESEMHRIAWQAITVLAVIMLLVVPLTLINSATITSPMRYACTVARAIASGDLNCRIRVVGRDEAAELLNALDTMQSSLRNLVGQVKDSTDLIESASNEVASGNLDLSQRTEQAASSLQQTTSSMVDLTAGVHHGAEAASNAKQLALTAAEVARRGGDEVAKVVSTMDEINSSSKRIGDILGLIDSIAFQTNILALNAAVEAARAGEQGRGFAVVAGEVRLLAQRSAGAAREIKSLIEASVQRTDTGARLVQHAGMTMQEIVASVQRVSDMIGEVADGASDQSARIGKINGAVSQLDNMTQQNAALVEESAAAAASLREQLHLLSGAVAQFRLEAHG
jgi:methyl-accepting chemotaxis protein